MLPLPRIATSPTRLCKERRRNVAAVRRTHCEIAPRLELWGYCRQLTGQSSGVAAPYVFRRLTVDIRGRRRIYKPSWRAAAWRDGASAKPLTDYSVNSIRLRRMCGLRRLLPSVPSRSRRGVRGRRRGPSRSLGCLTSESEERETWTAESLRTVRRTDRRLGFGPAARSGRDFGGLRFRSTPWCASIRVTDLVNGDARASLVRNVTGREKFSSNLRV